MEIKGTAVIAIRDYVKINYMNKYKEWLENLSPESKAIFSEAIDSTKWYSVNTAAIEPTILISEMFHNKDVQNGAWASGQYSAQKGLSGIYKIFVKASSPMFIIQRASRVFATYYQPCTIDVVKREGKKVVLHIKDATTWHEALDYRIGGWIQKALEISGSTNPQVIINKTGLDTNVVTEISIDWS